MSTREARWRSGRISVAALASMAFVAVIGCAEQAPGAGTGTSSAAIMGGSPSNDASAVLLFFAETNEGPYSQCSGVVVAPNLVMTAKHCTTRHKLGPMVCDSQGELVPDGSGIGVFGDPY